MSAAPVAAGEDLVTPVRVGRPDAPLRLTVWAQQDYSHLASRPAIAAVFHDVFEQWARAHPGVQLEISVMPALEMHKAKLLLAAAAHRLPDVASVDSFWMPLFLEGGHAQPLDPFWPAADRADYVPFAIQALSDRAGHVYGIWHGTDCRMLYYRKDLVPVPPRTWDELLSRPRASRASGPSRATPTNPGGGGPGTLTPLPWSGGRAGAWSTRMAGPCSARSPTAPGWSASCASCARRSRRGPRRAPCSGTTTTSSWSLPPSRATRPCSWAGAGSSPTSRPGSRPRSSRSGT